MNDSYKYFLSQASLRARSSDNWRSPGRLSRAEKDRKLTIMVAVMVS